MQIKCVECGTVFTWERPPGRHGTNPPKICGKPGKDGRWVPTPECKKSRNAKLYANWAKNNPTKVTANRKKQYIKRKANKKLQEYEYKDIPVGRQWPCGRCGKLSYNRFNCPTCLHILMKGISQEYQEFIYESNDIENIPLTGRI